MSRLAINDHLFSAKCLASEHPKWLFCTNQVKCCVGFLWQLPDQLRVIQPKPDGSDFKAPVKGELILAHISQVQFSLLPKNPWEGQPGRVQTWRAYLETFRPNKKEDRMSDAGSQTETQEGEPQPNESSASAGKSMKEKMMEQVHAQLQKMAYPRPLIKGSIDYSYLRGLKPLHIYGHFAFLRDFIKKMYIMYIIWRGIISHGLCNHVHERILRIALAIWAHRLGCLTVLLDQLTSWHLERKGSKSQPTMKFSSDILVFRGLDVVSLQEG